VQNNYDVWLQQCIKKMFLMVVYENTLKIQYDEYDLSHYFFGQQKIMKNDFICEPLLMLIMNKSALQKINRKRSFIT